MYEAHFNLREKPFSIQPDPAFMYWGDGHRLAYAMLEYGVLNGAGISIVTGGVGCGKTTLVHNLLERLGDDCAVALLSNIQAGRGDLLSWALMGFGQPFAGLSHVEKFAALQRYFVEEYACGRRTILIIDEAQNLSADMLEELRMLSNINAGKDQLLQLILVGQPQLKDLLNHPDMVQLTQRVGADFHLTSLTEPEVGAYLEARLAIAGADRPLFTADAAALIAAESAGVPRVINVLADTALVYAYSDNEPIVTAETVAAVVADKAAYGVFQRVGSSKEAAPRKAPATANRAPATPIPAPSPTPHGTPSPPPSPELVSAAARNEGSAARLPRKYVPKPRKGPDAPTQSMAPPPGAVSVAAIILETEDPDPARTQACLRSLAGTTTCVYLAANEDGPTAEAARREGADVVAFADVASFPGRARNAGYRALGASAAGAGAVYFGVDDIVVAPGWLNTAAGVLDRRPEIGAVFGPVPGLTLPLAGASVSDGEADAAAQSVLVRTRIFEELGGMRGALVANDLADLCLRMRRRGARVWRIGETMGKSDRVRRLGWWAHSQREGFAAAHGASLHGAAPDRFRVGELRAAVLWGGAAPGVAGLGWAAAIAVLPLNSGAAAAFAVVATAAAAGLAGRMVVGFLGRASAGQALGSSVKAAFVETASFTPRFLGAATFLLSGQTAQRSASGRRPAAA